MATSTRWCAALAALFLMVLVPAQANGAAARLAAAKLAEARGDFAGAESELRQALAGANDADRAAVQAQLAVLLRKQGKAVDAGAVPQEPAAAGDPVQRLIADLERGSEAVAEVERACKELQSLGSLAVPPLLTALPKLGPFGLSNALRVLGAQDNASIAPALLQRLEGAEPAVVEAIAERLAGMHEAVAVPVARALASRDLPPRALLGAFAALRNFRVVGDEVRTLGVRLAKQPTAHAALQDQLDDAKDDVALAVQAEIMATGTGSARAHATMRWLRSQQGLTEDAALARLQEQLEPRVRWWVARDVAEAHPQWARTALLALDPLEEAAKQVPQPWFQNVEWWRMPDQSAPKLLALAELAPEPNPNRTVLARLLSALVERGWLVPAGLQQALAALLLPRESQYQRAFVRAIPVAEEERALATWQSLDAPMRRQFTDVVVQLDRPWHRLVARQLAACEQAGEIHPNWINRDWRGAPADAVEGLVATVVRFPTGPDGIPQWHQLLPPVYELCTNLPAALVRPAAERGNASAWYALASREPKEALALARAWADIDHNRIPALDRLLGEHGTDEDVPLAVKAVKTTANGGPVMPGTEAFLSRPGRGRLDVVALGWGGLSPSNDLRRRVVFAAAAGVRIEQLTEVLALLDGLTMDVWTALVEALHRQVRGEHGKLIADALAAPCAKGVEANRLHLLAQLAAMAKNPVCLPPLRQLLAKGTNNGPVQDGAAVAVAGAMLDLAGTARRPMIEELLASANPLVVGVALLAPELRADAELRALSKAAIVRLADSIQLDYAVFAALEPADAAALAKDLLLHERFAAMPEESCIAVLEAPRRAKRTQAPATLAHGASHPSANVRIRAAIELGNTFTREAAPFLIEMLKDESPAVRQQASQCLDQIANYLDARAKWEERLK